MEDKIEIKFSKTKILLHLLGATAFVVFGVLFMLYPQKFQGSFFGSLEIVKIAGIAAVTFFGLCLVFILRKLFDNKVGLKIDQSGITDNSNATSVGLIEWIDVTNIFTIEVGPTKILMIETDKPKKYIERAKNGIARRAMKANHKMYGSPLSIISNSLKIEYNDLEKLIIREFEKWKSFHRSSQQIS